MGLEEKLKELGYKIPLNPIEKNIYFKTTTLYIFSVKIENGKITNNLVYFLVRWIPFDNLQQAFNEMQKDLEELKKVFGRFYYQEFEEREDE